MPVNHDRAQTDTIWTTLGSAGGGTNGAVSGDGRVRWAFAPAASKAKTPVSKGVHLLVTVTCRREQLFD